ncbi:hypothetical protein [Streptomyces flavochromogenes]|uniref:hypothetical protein n=1 Tax=Streptomyces flavochromogenes TaxID=68199 RepID=UPI0004C1E749|nr:hypothetical protein [Streptomyces flavochromogenes]
MTQPEPAQTRNTACLLNACARDCTTECREAINRTWTALRGELPPATLLTAAEPVPPSDTEELRSGRRLAQPQPTTDPLRNLVDRAEHHGGLTADEAARLRDGIQQLHAELDRLTALAVRASDRAIENGQRADRAEAALDAVRALHASVQYGKWTICGHCSGYGGGSCDNGAEPHPCATIRALDAHTNPTDQPT